MSEKQFDSIYLNEPFRLVKCLCDGAKVDYEGVTYCARCKSVIEPVNDSPRKSDAVSGIHLTAFRRVVLTQGWRCFTV